MAFPRATIPIEPFVISHSADQLTVLKTLLRLSPLGPATYENGPHRASNYGISLRQMHEIRDAWLAYDWPRTEQRLNAMPQFRARVPDRDPKTGKETTMEVHFLAYTSGKQAAVPVLLLHGWPGMGCFELQPMVEHLQRHAKRPLDIIIPSLPGYLYSSSPPTDREYDFDDVARLMHTFMLGLGYGAGYATQGGDLGSFVSRVMACRYDECKVSHFNFMQLKLTTPALVETPLHDPRDKAHVARWQKFQKTGMGYAMEHATRPATISFAVASSPLALLAWVGEKLVDSWDPDMPLPVLLQWLTLFWLTQSFPTSIYMYRHLSTCGDFTVAPTAAERADPTRRMPGLRIVGKKMGYSTFPGEIFPVPRAWAAKTGDLVFYRLNEKGGHFAGCENPELLGRDFAEFLEMAWPRQASKL